VAQPIRYCAQCQVDRSTPSAPIQESPAHPQNCSSLRDWFVDFELVLPASSHALRDHSTMPVFYSPLVLAVGQTDDAGVLVSVPEVAGCRLVHVALECRLAVEGDRSAPLVLVEKHVVQVARQVQEQHGFAPLAPGLRDSLLTPKFQHPNEFVLHPAAPVHCVYPSAFSHQSHEGRNHGDRYGPVVAGWVCQLSLDLVFSAVEW